MRQPTEMTVPLVDLKAQYDSIRADVLAAITRVCDSQQFILGPEVELLEQELAAYLSAKHAVGVSSGTDALLAIMMGLGIGPGDEVITTTYSFFSTAGSIVRLGATPVFVDIDPATFNIDPDAARDAITSRTKAIVPVHLFGLSADLDPLLTATSGSGVSIIEDSWNETPRSRATMHQFRRSRIQSSSPAHPTILRVQNSKSEREKRMVRN